MKKYFTLLFVLGTLIVSEHSHSQLPNIAKPVNYSVESSFFLSNGNAPFWQQANQNGEIPTYQYASSWTKGSLAKYYAVDSVGKNKVIDWGAGATGIISVSNTPSLFFSQIYAQLKVSKFELSVGRRYEQIGIIDQNLSSGSYSFSNNALPIPKIQLASLGFVEVPLTKHLVSFKFNYADGLVGETQGNPFNTSVNIKDTYLHQKSLYARFGKPKWKLNLYGGFCHQVMWGGEYQIWPTGFDLTRSHRYWGVIRGESWSGSRIGNHVANLDLGFSYRNSRFDLMAYRQSIVEDGALYRGLSNISDGLNGVLVNFKKKSSNKITFKSALFEFLYTFSQGGSVFDLSQGIIGRNNYFNHYIYLNGWSYQNRTLGTPFIAPQTSTRDDLPRNSFTNNNRLWLLHFGFSGTAFGKYTFLSKISFSNNAGTYDTPFPKATNQFSGFLQLKAPSNLFGGSEMIGSVALDIGKLYPNQMSISWGIRKSGALSKDMRR